MDLPELTLQQGADGVRLKLRVVPGARRDAVLGPYGDALRVAVRAAPEKGRANEAVERLLARTLAVAPADIALVAGHGGRDKVLEVRRLDADELRRRLAALLAAQDPAR